MEDSKYLAAMMVKKLKSNVLNGRKWFYSDSPVININEEHALSYDYTLEKIEKKHHPNQEEFYIITHSFIE